MQFLPALGASPADYVRLLSSYGERAALAVRQDGKWAETSYAQLVQKTEMTAARLVMRGIHPGDRVALVGASHPLYMAGLLGILQAGAVAVPLDPRLAPAERQSILDHCEARLCLDLQSLEELLKSPLEGDVTLPPQRDPKSMHFLFYTSGTTGSPKGVMLSWDAIRHEVVTLAQLDDIREERFLSLLPPNHLFELSAGLLGALIAGASVSFANTLLPNELLQCFVDRRITRLLCVPLVLEMLRNGIMRELKRAPASRQKIFKLMLSSADMLPRPLRRVMFGPVHKKFGGKLRRFISGGAPLKVETYTFFHRLGFEVYQGYGLTETAPVLTVETPGNRRAGTVGRPIPGVELKVDSRGHLLARGPNIMLGYYKNPELTAQVLSPDGWFDTGDLGEIDKDGYLTIKGRSKNLIVLPNGKKIHPEEVEDVVAGHEGVEDVCVVPMSVQGAYGPAEGVGAVIFPKEELLHLEDCEIIKKIGEVRHRLADYKWPARIIVARRPLPKTATRKIIRHQVMEAYL